MPDIDWSDVFGPAPQRQSSASNAKDLDAATNEFRSISDRALKLRKRLTRSHAVGLEESALASPLLQEVEESRIVSQNVDAVLKVVDEILREKREKRIAEESIVKWPWHDTMMARMRARPSVKNKDLPRQGADVKEEAELKSFSKERSSTSTIKRQSGNPNRSAHQGLSNAPPKRSHVQSTSRAELQSLAQPRQSSCIRSHSSSLYSRSTNDTASHRSVRRELGLSTASTETYTASDDPMIAWPWPSTIVQAATGRSSTTSSLSRAKMGSPPPTNVYHT
ncbi:uncharacterized protein RHO25_008948 [Cercospora beticola]|uniref:Uncharacterized protein n=1 Tax=Cercospora beticola TaxID=122368 RepID=A0ABZ0NXH1_CERBT|nr:hypothetical protein RHO25_008948 [Cercospora beticola]